MNYFYMYRKAEILLHMTQLSFSKYITMSETNTTIFLVNNIYLCITLYLIKSDLFVNYSNHLRVDFFQT